MKNQNSKVLGPGCLKDRLLPYDPTQQLRPSQGALLKEPSLKEVRGTACRQRAFLAAAPRLWNAFPTDLSGTDTDDISAPGQNVPVPEGF